MVLRVVRVCTCQVQNPPFPLEFDFPRWHRRGMLSLVLRASSFTAGGTPQSKAVPLRPALRDRKRQSCFTVALKASGALPPKS